MLIAPYDIKWGHGSSPTLWNDLLILLADHGPNAYLLALDKRDDGHRDVHYESSVVDLLLMGFGARAGRGKTG